MQHELGNHSKQNWQSLSDEANHFYQQGRYDEAILIALQACDVAR